MSDGIVVDASVVLALLRGEPLGKFDATGIMGSTISAVNFCEVMTKLISDGMPAEAAGNAVSQLDFKVIPFDGSAASIAAQLWRITRTRGLSLADRACIGLGLSLDATIVTADRVWGRLGLGKISVIR